MIDSEIQRSDSSVDCDSDEESHKTTSTPHSLDASVGGNSRRNRAQLANYFLFDRQQSSAMPGPSPRATLVNFAQNLSPPSREDEGDWCEDSMAVELSSVDSLAVQDLREISIEQNQKLIMNLSYKQDCEVNLDTSPLLAIHRVHQNTTDDILARQPMRSVSSSVSSTTLSNPAEREQTHEENNDSEDSIATSLFVEVIRLSTLQLKIIKYFFLSFESRLLQ
jgi:hypothetical protein